MPEPAELLCVHCGLPVPATRRSADPQASRFCCFGCRFVYDLASVGPADSDDQADPPSGSSDASATAPTAPLRVSPLFLKLGASIFLVMNIMAVNGLVYSRALHPPMDPAELRWFQTINDLFAYLMMFLCSLVLAILGLPLAGDAVPRLLPRRDDTGRLTWRPRIDANLLILIGTFAAFGLSVVHTLRGEGGIYYETAAVILVLMALGSYVESGARLRATREAEAFFERLPTRAWVQRDGAIVEVSHAELRVGDRVRVRPGEALPVDGVVAQGQGHVNESSLTGESQPRAVEPGQRAFAGSISVDGLLWLDATAVGGDRLVAQMRRLLDEARKQQPSVQRLADRTAALFVPGVLALSLVVFVWRAAGGDLSRGLFDALSVLLISCPCALGLSAPLATWSAMGRAARRGILIGSGAVLERMASVNHVMFDKTGTLTTSAMRLRDCRVAPGSASERGSELSIDQAITLAASVEAGSTHPVAAALLAEARARQLPVTAPASAGLIPGVGIAAIINGITYRMGSHRLIADPLSLPKSWHVPDDDGLVRVYLTDEHHVLAEFALAEEVRADAAATIAELRGMGIEVEVLTGDRPGPAQRLASQLGIACRAGLLPDGKLDEVRQRRQTGARAASGRIVIAMVGDGINDAPALAAADVGFAMGGGADLARQAGNVHLISDRLSRVPESIRLARHAMRRIRVNLALSFGYNSLGLALAAAGYMHPFFAASAMIISSLAVVLSSRNAGLIPLTDPLDDPAAARDGALLLGDPRLAPAAPASPVAAPPATPRHSGATP